MARKRVFDDMHKRLIKALITKAHLSDGEIARLIGTARSNIRYLRKLMRIPANFAPGKRFRKKDRRD